MCDLEGGFDASDSFDIGSDIDTSDSFDLGSDIGSSEDIGFESDLIDPIESASFDETEDLPFEAIDSFDDVGGLEEAADIPVETVDEAAEVEGTDEMSELPFETADNVDDVGGLEEAADIPVEAVDEAAEVEGTDEISELPFETADNVDDVGGLEEAADIPVEAVDEAAEVEGTDEMSDLPFETADNADDVGGLEAADISVETTDDSVSLEPVDETRLMDSPESVTETAESGPDTFQMVRPNEIDMSDELGMDDPYFWNHHGNTKEDYMDLAGKLPEVQERLDGGESLDDLYQDPDVGATARQYYHPDHMIKLEADPDGNLVSTGDGRHRLLAAQELGYDVPVNINHAAGEKLEDTQELSDGVSAETSDVDISPFEARQDQSSDVPDWDRTALSPSEESIIREMDDNGEIDIPQVNPNLTEPEKGELHLPSDSGEFAGERGNSAFVPNNAEAVEMMNGFGQDHVDYVNGYPDFSPFTKQETPWGPMDCQVEIGHMTDQRTNPAWEFGRRPSGAGHDPNYDLGNFAQADNALLEKMRELNPDATLTDVKDFIDSNHLTWHECPDGKTMQLVPTAIHDACKHSGGVSEMKYRMAFGDVELPF